MCGISGIYRMGETPISEDAIRILLCSLEHRGNDATGIGLMTNGKIDVFKSDKPAWQFIGTKEYKDFILEHLKPETLTAILHTRFATKDYTPRDNENNHPMMDNQTAIVHNGGVDNHEAMFTKLGTERLAKTDSDVIRAYVSKFGITPKCIREMVDMRGSIAAACINVNYPDKLMLLHSGSPLIVAKVGDQLFWASEKEAIHKASRPWYEWKKFWLQKQKPELEFCAVAEDTGLIIGPDGLEFHDKFHTCWGYVKPDYTRTKTEFASRQLKWDRLAKPAIVVAANKVETKVAVKTKTTGDCDYYQCRNPKCDTILTVKDTQRRLPLWRLGCTACLWKLAEIPTMETIGD